MLTKIDRSQVQRLLVTPPFFHQLEPIRQRLFVQEGALLRLDLARRRDGDVRIDEPKNDHASAALGCITAQRERAQLVNVRVRKDDQSTRRRRDTAEWDRRFRCIDHSKKNENERKQC